MELEYKTKVQRVQMIERIKEELNTELQRSAEVILENQHNTINT